MWAGLGQGRGGDGGPGGASVGGYSPDVETDTEPSPGEVDRAPRPIPAAGVSWPVLPGALNLSGLSLSDLPAHP